MRFRPTLPPRARESHTPSGPARLRLVQLRRIVVIASVSPVVVAVGATVAVASHADRGSGLRPAAAAPPAAQVEPDAGLQALVDPRVHVAGHASRSSRRSPHRAAVPARLAPHAWVRPNAGPLSSGFGYRWGRLHEGIDLAGGYGSPIVAATSGCITYAGPMSGYGEVLMIRDWDGTETVYGHMSSFVRTSGCVRPGTLVARVGAAGDATGPHLHFEVRIGDAPVDPIPFLARHHVWV